MSPEAEVGNAKTGTAAAKIDKIAVEDIQCSSLVQVGLQTPQPNICDLLSL
jgi:hypothetical protein